MHTHTHTHTFAYLQMWAIITGRLWDLHFKLKALELNVWRMGRYCACNYTGPLQRGKLFWGSFGDSLVKMSWKFQCFWVIHLHHNSEHSPLWQHSKQTDSLRCFNQQDEVWKTTICCFTHTWIQERDDLWAILRTKTLSKHVSLPC